MGIAYQTSGRNQPEKLSSVIKLKNGRVPGLRKPKRRMKKMVNFDPGGFGRRVRELREKLGISQAALAKAIGVGQQTVNNWESGAVKKTSAIVEVARALSTTPEWLQRGEGQKESRPFRPIDEIVRLYGQLGEAKAMIVVEFMRSLLRNPPHKRIVKKPRRTAA